MNPEYDNCKACGEIFPEDMLNMGGYCGTCRKFTAPLAKKGSKATLQKRVAKLAAKTMMSSLTRTQINVPHTSELAAEVVARMGGLEAVAKKYVQVVEAILEEGKSSRLALSAIDGVSKLIQASTVMRETAPDAQNLSDEALETELQRIIEAKMRRGDIVLELEHGEKS